MRTKMMLMAALAAALVMTVPGVAQTPAAKTADSSKSAAKKADAMPAPTAKEIADASAKGLVWVNTSTKVYHKDGQFYGKTKQGMFMTEADAQKAGNRAAKASPIQKTKTDVKK